ncbi:hypothetical protein HpBGD78_01100 [Helicobacter pylori]
MLQFGVNGGIYGNGVILVSEFKNGGAAYGVLHCGKDHYSSYNKDNDNSILAIMPKLVKWNKFRIKCWFIEMD